MQLLCISVMAFLETDLFLDRIPLEGDSRGSAMTNHKKLIDLFSLYILFSHFRPPDATRGNSLF